MKIYDPMEIVKDIGSRRLRGLAPAPPGWVYVVDRERRDLAVLTDAKHRLTAGELWWGGLRTLYQVDVREHPMDFTTNFPCADDVGGFRAEVLFTCQVTDPVAVVRRGVNDVARALEPALKETLRRSCETFRAEESQAAEAAGLAALRSLEAESGHDGAFHITRVQLHLSLDDAAAAHVRRMKDLLRERAQSTEQHQLDRGKLTAEGEIEIMRLAQQREAQRYKAELAALQQKHELDLVRAHQVHDLELAKAQQAHDLELQGVQVTQIRELLEAGEFTALAFQLSANPNSIGQIIEYLARERNAEQDHKLKALQIMLDNNAMEGYQLSDQAKNMLEQLVSGLSGRGWPLPGSALLASPSPAGVTEKPAQAQVIDVRELDDAPTLDGDPPGPRGEDLKRQGTDDETFGPDRVEDSSGPQAD